MRRNKLYSPKIQNRESESQRKCVRPTAQSKIARKTITPVTTILSLTGMLLLSSNKSLMIGFASRKPLADYTTDSPLLFNCRFANSNCVARSSREIPSTSEGFSPVGRTAQV